MSRHAIIASFALRLLRSPGNEESVAALIAPFRPTAPEVDLRKIVLDVVERGLLFWRSPDRVKLTPEGLRFAQSCDDLFAGVALQLRAPLLTAEQAAALEQLEDRAQEAQAALDEAADFAEREWAHGAGNDWAKVARLLRCALAGMRAAGFVMKGSAAGQPGAPS